MSDRRSHWDSVYTAKSPFEVGWYQRDPTCSLDLIAASGIARDAPIIDVGGGASVLVDRLLERGFSDLTVLDVSERALGYARERLGAAAQRVQWLRVDVTEFVSPRRFRLWHDRAVFHFLTDAAERRRYLQALLAVLEPGGHLILAAFAPGGPSRCSGLEVVQYDAGRLQAELGGELELREAIAEAHLTPSNQVQAYGYFRFVRRRREGQ